jgi:alkanesulfonate monooxygenase SsuD/methylene tetrahydromethanopterin reductase-like flavin-dependent oxidoreductase (luciferase family)
VTTCVEVGVASFTQKSTYMEPLPFPALYEQTLNEVRYVESLGFDAVWMGEHHFSYEGQCPSVWPALARIAAATERIKIGTGVMLLPFHSTQRVAEACAAIDAISPGRLRLAVGAGYREVEFAAHGVPRSARGKTRDARIEELRSPPWQDRMGSTEVWIGGEAPAVIRSAVRFGAPLLLHVDVDKLRSIRALAEAEVAEGRGTMPELAVIREVWVEDDPRRAAWVRGRYQELWHHYAAIANAESPYRTSASARKLTVAEVSPGGGVTTQDPEELADIAIIGSAGEVVERLTEFLEAGARRLVFHIRIGGMPTAALRENLEALATQVVPRLKEAA